MFKSMPLYYILYPLRVGSACTFIEIPTWTLILICRPALEYRVASSTVPIPSVSMLLSALWTHCASIQKIIICDKFVAATWCLINTLNGKILHASLLDAIVDGIVIIFRVQGAGLANRFGVLCGGNGLVGMLLWRFMNLLWRGRLVWLRRLS
ncbi:hypothetical protein BCR34DRAFT_574186 [Clohesyomyces aquaticus]|uniref:Uncharacterized protein n=1 Tax=Clohesyomyces aquaticus TaxID=1231657 RepID=A0A1Y1YWF8_9PLEO|nr:hypothetical protein BCR34DRAFT_574186 [Clohesyomyces aquaticus]